MNNMPIVVRIMLTKPTENIPEEMTFLAQDKSLLVIAFTKLFLIPLPIPKSKFRNHIRIDNNVYQMPKTSLLLK